jgi:polysaccharide biosynthesis protein PslH
MSAPRNLTRMPTKPKLLFVSPRHLIPADSGGKIRTRDVLMGLKGGRFEVTLVAPCDRGRAQADREAIDKLCDRFVSWPAPRRGALFGVARMRHALSPVPIPVATDRSVEGERCIARELAKKPDVVVVDFPHTGVLVPDFRGVPSVLFTHNVETEIFRRHAEVAKNFALRALWRDQTHKMARFEREELARYDAVIAIAQRDKSHFEADYGIRNVATIPTGVNLEIYAYQPPPEDDEQQIMFSGSMDWLANRDAIEFFLNDVWARIAAARPTAQFIVIGRSPPAKLIDLAKERRLRCTFTGFVDDVQPYIRAAQVCVIPLRVGGGTRLKVYESMAMGCPVVSTTIGVEGLPIEAGTHYELADSPQDFADAVIGLLDDPARRRQLAENARRYVETNFSHKNVAKIFEDICLGVCR